MIRDFLSVVWRQFSKWELEIARDRSRVKSGGARRAVGELFYPRSRAKEIPQADKFVIPFILFSIVVAVAELGYSIWGSKEYQGAFNVISGGILVIFLIEFIARLWVRGSTYLFRWGILDVVPIFAEIAALLVLVFSIFEEYSFFSVAALARGFRLVRLIRMNRIFLDTKFWKSKISGALPYVWAVTKSIVYSVLILVVLQLFLSVILLRDPVEGLSLSFRLLWENLGVESIDGETGLDSLGALILSVALANLIALFFVPEGQRIAEEQRKQNPFKYMSNHIIIFICNPEYSTILEEMVHVWGRLAGRNVIIISDQSDAVTNQSDIPGRVFFVASSISNLDTWRQVCAESSDAVYILGESQLALNSIPFIFSYMAREERVLPIYEISKQSYAVQCVVSQVTCRITKVPLHHLEMKIADQAWKDETLIQSYIKRIAADFDAVPHHSERQGCNDKNNHGGNLSEFLTKNLEEHAVNFKITSEANTRLILVDDNYEHQMNEEEVDEWYTNIELSLISLFDREYERLSSLNIRIIAYVKTYRLAEWNDLFSEKQGGEPFIEIIPIELQTAFALYHDVEIPGILYGWIKDAVGSEQINLDGKKGKAMTEKGLQELSGRNCILGIKKPNGKILCFADSENDTIYLEKGDVILYPQEKC